MPMPAEGTELRQAIKELTQRTGKSTQDAQARKLGISDTSLGAYLAGTQIPRESTMIKMLVGAGIPTGEHAKYLETRRRAEDAPRGQHAHTNRQSTHTSPLLDEKPPPAARTAHSTSGIVRESFGSWVWVMLSLLVLVSLALLVFLQSRSPSAPPVAMPAPLQAGATTDLRCSLVDVASSPVYAEIGDGEPVKFKGFGDRVRLLPFPQRTGSDGTAYQAVALPDPRDSVNGVGWMRTVDLKSDPRECAGLGKRP